MARIVFLGTSDFAAAVLDGLAARGERPLLVLTRPDRPRGRGRRTAAPPVAEVARRLALALSQPDDINGSESLTAIGATRPDAVCICAFGALIREPLLSRHELINVHPSLLPRWRGAAPIERSIMAGDSRTGVSIMRVGPGLDDGPVGLTGGLPVGPADTFGSLADRLAPLGAELLVRTLREPTPFVEQAEGAVTYAHKIGPEDRRLDPRRPASELERVVRALHPHIGAHVVLPSGDRLGIRASHVARGGADGGARPEPGALIADGARLLLACGEGALELDLVQPAGGRPMDAASFLRGHSAALARE